MMSATTWVGRSVMSARGVVGDLEASAGGGEGREEAVAKVEVLEAGAGAEGRQTLALRDGRGTAVGPGGGNVRQGIPPEGFTKKDCSGGGGDLQPGCNEWSRRREGC